MSDARMVWQVGGGYILVDGGRSNRAFPGILMAHAAPPHLDIVVCAHNDADHANGIVGLLEAPPVPTWSRRSTGLISTPYSMRRRSTGRGSSAATPQRSSSFIV